MALTKVASIHTSLPSQSSTTAAYHYGTPTPPATPVHDAATVSDAVAQAAFSEKKWVWVRDRAQGYVAGYVTSELPGERPKVVICLKDGTTRTVNDDETEQMNPPKFDKVEDMADLTFLNESSVIHNLRLRYESSMIYTYSGLFLVAVNPYHDIPIYTDRVIRSYRYKRRDERPPHIYAISDAAYHCMVTHGENQSILITGESGAGKTENTKKVIQYLAATASDAAGEDQLGLLEQQILQANPILEAFGNAQTIRNNNSSRFGKFIRIEFSSEGHIAGANIERYLLEKSRVTYQTAQERNFHVFYQLLKGAPTDIKEKLMLDGTLDDYRFVKNSKKDIEGVDDEAEFRTLTGSMDIVGFTAEEQFNLFRIVAAVLHLGNIQVTAARNDQAYIPDMSEAEKVCRILGVSVEDFVKELVNPHVKAGREWVAQARTKQQVQYSIEALAKALYERSFGALVDRINQATNREVTKANFIGVLDIAGFEIFEINGFEQLCINYTNEKLQQFFNHHMFVLEQEEYCNENIEWQFIDFGLDLQPTIDLIEKTNPIGILSCLDEECVMPKATDKTFIDKLNNLWHGKSRKYDARRFHEGFILNHYAAKVEYSTNGWLDKNKDPLNENVTRLLARSSEEYVAALFVDYASDATEFSPRKQTKRGFFRTVTQRHKEQLHSLMQQLYSTKPHFVRCIVPNYNKKAGEVHVPLILDQLRCNGVLEGIRICRAGFPNRLLFAEFRQRYGILSSGVLSSDDRVAALELLKVFRLQNSEYRIGLTKIFFRAGVLASLEELRDTRLAQIFSGLQAHCRGRLSRRKYRKMASKLLAVRTIQKNVRMYFQLREWSWWKLYSQSKPRLHVTYMNEALKRRDERIQELEERLQHETEQRRELEDVVLQLQEENRSLRAQLDSRDFAALERANSALKAELEETRARLDAETHARHEEAAGRRRLVAELDDMKLRYETESVKAGKLSETVDMYRARASGTVSRLETVEYANVKAAKTEELLKQQIKELEEAFIDAVSDRKSAEEQAKALEEQVQCLEAKLEDDALSRTGFQQFRQRLEEELEEERVRYRKDLEEHEVALEDTRKKYQKELVRLAEEVDVERANLLRIREENRELQNVIEDLRSEAEDEEAHATSSWRREKERLESKIANLAQLYEDAMNAHDELQVRILKQLNEVRELRAALDEAESQKMLLEKLKGNLEERLSEQYHSENQNKQAAERSLSALDNEIDNLRQQIEEQQDAATIMSEKLRRAELQALEAQTELTKERDENQDLMKVKIAMDKQIKELNLRVIDLETKSMASPRSVKRVEARVEELSRKLENETREKSEAVRSARKNERAVRELQLQLADRDQQRVRLGEDAGRLDQKIARMRAMIEELQTSESSLQLTKRRAEREGMEASERAARLERELERLKSRLDRTSIYSE